MTSSGRWAADHDRVAREVRAYLAGLEPADEQHDQNHLDDSGDGCADGAA